MENLATLQRLGLLLKFPAKREFSQKIHENFLRPITNHLPSENSREWKPKLAHKNVQKSKALDDFSLTNSNSTYWGCFQVALK
jgi:hypothetical protein